MYLNKRGRYLTLAMFSLMVFVAALFAQTSSTYAQGKVNFEGKTIRVVVSAAAGGGTDSAGRVMARFIPKFLPGNPKIFVQNMPGGGGILGNNYFFNKAKPNGLDLFQASSSTVSQLSR